MDDRTVFGRLLMTLAVSPMWNWDAPPMLWAVICEDPVVITPAIMMRSIGELKPMAEHWRSHMPDDIPADTLCLVCEGAFTDGPEVRDAIVIHRDGGMAFFRHTRGTEVIQQYDPTESTIESVEVMREVATKKW